VDNLTPQSLPGKISWLLEEGFFGYIGTSDRNAEPHVTPVIFVFDQNHIYFLTSKSAKKLRNMEQNPKIAFLIDIRDPSNLLNNRAVLLLGSVKKISILDAILHIRQLLKIRRLFFLKYPKYVKTYTTDTGKIPRNWRVTPFLHRILLRLTIDKYVYMRECFQAQTGV